MPATEEIGEIIVNNSNGTKKINTNIPEHPKPGKSIILRPFFNFSSSLEFSFAPSLSLGIILELLEEDVSGPFDPFFRTSELLLDVAVAPVVPVDAFFIDAAFPIASLAPLSLNLLEAV